MVKNSFVGKKIAVNSGAYAVVKVHNAPKNSFAAIKDKKETTAVVNEKFLSKIKMINVKEAGSSSLLTLQSPLVWLGLWQKWQRKWQMRK